MGKSICCKICVLRALMLSQRRILKYTRTFSLKSGSGRKLESDFAVLSWMILKSEIAFEK